MRKRKSLFLVLVLSVVLFAGCIIYFLQEDAAVEKQPHATVDVEDEIPKKDEAEREKAERDEVEKDEAESEEYLQATEEAEAEEEIKEELPDDDDFVEIKTYIPDIVLELKYAGTDNFTGQKIYDFTEAYLRYGTVKKLMQVQDELREKGLFLKIWDAFRPVSAQFTLWEVYPDATYVANPNTGFSSHSRGNTVDVTIVDGNGQEIVMPTGFDDFSKLADRDYRDCSKEAAEHALLLEDTMIKYGFRAYSGEWWHFTDVDTYPVEEEFEP